MQAGEGMISKEKTELLQEIPQNQSARGPGYSIVSPVSLIKERMFNELGFNTKQASLPHLED